jgi:hypothetical protein
LEEHPGGSSEFSAGVNTGERHRGEWQAAPQGFSLPSRGSNISLMYGLGYVYQCECGRRYRVWSLPMTMRDKDSIECECGRTIKEWNEGKTWHADLIDEPQRDPIERSESD